MKLISIDASTKSSGVALFEDNNLIEYHCITCNDKNVYKRLQTMAAAVIEFCEKHNPDKIVMEEVVPEDVHGNDTAFKPLMYLQGYIVCGLNNINKTIDKLYISTEWRSKCGIKTGPNIHRDQLKSAAIALVKDKYGVFANDDICDAICIGMATFMETPPKPPKKNPTVTENGFVFG